MLLISLQELFQNQCLIVLFISSSIDEGDCSFPGFFLQHFYQIMLLTNLSFSTVPQNLFHLSGSCANHFRSSVLGAISFSQRSNARLFLS